MTNPKLIFVSLQLCTRLAEYGLTRDTWAVWREYQVTTSDEQKDLYLVAPGMDLLNMYGPIELPEGIITRPFIDTPAYTLTDMLMCSPGFCLSMRDPLHVEIASLSIFDIPPVSGPHTLPDAAALHVLSSLERERIPVAILNQELLNHPIKFQ